MREFRVRRASELRAVELAAEVGEARLRQLTAQIEPHFLFNSLNAISNRMHEDVARGGSHDDPARRPPACRVRIRRFGARSASPRARWLRNYLAMMAERFRGQLEYDLDVEPGLDAVPVPRLLLQPLVENALKHGLAAAAAASRSTVRRRGDDLEYAVSDDGVGSPAPSSSTARGSPTWRGASSCCSARATLGRHAAHAARRHGHRAVSARRMSYAVVIVDDEPPARAKLRRLLAELPDFRVVAEAAESRKPLPPSTRASARRACISTSSSARKVVSTSSTDSATRMRRR